MNFSSVQTPVSASAENPFEITKSDSPWILNINFQPYSIDMKTETLSTLYFSLALFSTDNSSAIRGFILKSDQGGSMAFGTDVFENSSSRQRILFQADTDPTKTQPRTWQLQPERKFLIIGSPFDYYSLSIFFAVNETLNLQNNNTLLNIPQTLLGQWDFSDKLERFDKTPSNYQLTDRGLNAALFEKYASEDGKWPGTGHLQDYYLYTLTISQKPIYMDRIALAFLVVPSIILFFFIIVFWRYFRKSLSFSDLLKIYMAIAFFTVPFLVSYYQFAPPASFTLQESLLLGDFIVPTFMLLWALFTKDRINRNQV